MRKYITIWFLVLIFSNTLLLSYWAGSRNKRPVPNDSGNKKGISAVQIIGKKMEILPRESTQVFSGDVLVEHSSFTMRADKVISRRSNTIVEAYGNVKIISNMIQEDSSATYYSRSISGEEAVYFSSSSSGTVKGNPSVITYTDDKNNFNRLESPEVNFSTFSIVATGNPTILTRQEYDKEISIRIFTSQKMIYEQKEYDGMSSSEKFLAIPVEELFVTEKNKYISRLKADELFYDLSRGKVYLNGNVSGRISFTPK